jgi:hypothetical protein
MSTFPIGYLGMRFGICDFSSAPSTGSSRASPASGDLQRNDYRICVLPLSLQKDGSPKDIQALLHHANIKTTLRVYQQAILGNVSKTVNRWRKGCFNEQNGAVNRRVKRMKEIRANTAKLLKGWYAREDSNL